MSKSHRGNHPWTGCSARLPSIARHKGAEERYLITLLDSLVVAKDFTYGEFNNVLPFGPDVEALREAEGQYPELGIARFGTPDEGISTISLLATVSAVFCGKRLGVILQEDDTDTDNLSQPENPTPLDEKLILGFTLLDDAGAVTDSELEGSVRKAGGLPAEEKEEEDLFESDPVETKETEFTYTRIDDKKDETGGYPNERIAETVEPADEEAWEVEDEPEIPDEVA